MITTTALQFVILLGIVSLFADMTYEGARSITGQYLALLGANATIIGVVAGLGELIGYSLRFVSGYISDRSGRYWLFTFWGYVLNLFTVPLLALATSWPLAATLIILERLGKAIRTPARDAMLSYATHEMGRGWGFGIHEAMDQFGAILGPLAISLLLYYHVTYQMSFVFLLIPAVCALTVLAVARSLYPRPQDLEPSTPEFKIEGFSTSYWLYVAATCCIAAGYVDFPLIAYHFIKNEIISAAGIPILFALAMASAAITSLILGHLYDKRGIIVLIITTLAASLFAPLVFFDNIYGAAVGIILWGLGLGSQGSIMRAVVATLVNSNRRATAYGLFNIWFGLFWFLGSSLMGFLYDISLLAVTLFSVAAQLAAIPFLLLQKRS